MDGKMRPPNRLDASLWVTYPSYLSAGREFNRGTFYRASRRSIERSRLLPVRQFKPHFAQEVARNKLVPDGLRCGGKVLKIAWTRRCRLREGRGQERWGRRQERSRRRQQRRARVTFLSPYGPALPILRRESRPST